MAESSFRDAIVYGLSVLTSSCLTLKEEQLLSVKAMYVFVWLAMGFGQSLSYQILPFVFHYKLGLTGSGKSSAVLVVSGSGPETAKLTCQALHLSDY